MKQFNNLKPILLKETNSSSFKVKLSVLDIATCKEKLVWANGPWLIKFRIEKQKVFIKLPKPPRVLHLLELREPR